MNLTKRVLLAALLPVFLLSAERASAYYDPGTQRWLSRDPIAERGGVNLYAFTFNNPVSVIDVFGNDPACSAYTGFGMGMSAEQLTQFSRAAAPGAAVLGVATAALILSDGTALPAIGGLWGRILGWLGLGGATAESPQGQAAIRAAAQEGNVILDKIARFEDAVAQAQIRLRIALTQMNQFPDKNSLGHISAEEQWRAAQKELSNAQRALARAKMCGD
jgi:hypothetical protein